MKFRLPLFWIQALLAFPVIQPSLAQESNEIPPATVNTWYGLTNAWNTSSGIQLTSNLSVKENSYDGDEGGTMILANGRSMTINGGQGNDRYVLTRGIGIIRETTIVRPFIVDGGTLALNNLKFTFLFEHNMDGAESVQLQPAGRSSEGGDKTRTLYACGAAVLSKSETSVVNIVNCVFNNNVIIQDKASKTAGTSVVSGGAIGGNGLFTVLLSSFDTNEAVATLSRGGTLASARGGAIRAQHLQVGNSDFTGNYAKATELQTQGAEVSARGGAIVAEGGNDEITVIGSDFTANYALAASDYGQKAEAVGGALSLDVAKDIVDQPQVTVGYNTFTGNYAQATGNYYSLAERIDVSSLGGAASFTQEDFVTGCTFTGNYAVSAIVVPVNVLLDDIIVPLTAKARGGAAYGSNFDKCTFTGNYVEVSAFAKTADGSSVAVGETSALGGALYMNSGTVKNSSFLGNYTVSASMSRGGGIYLAPSEENFSLNIIASEKQSVFRGNRMNVSQRDQDGRPADGTANAIYIDASDITRGDSTLDFRAASGLSVQLFDPIVVDAGEANVKFSFNRPGNADDPHYDGVIVFRGDSDFSGIASPDNRISYTSSAVSMHQYGGEVAIADGAVLGASVKNTQALEIGAQRYDMDKGVLEMTTNGHLMSSQMQFGSDVQEKASCTFRNGTGARMTADSIVINNGLTFDFLPFVDSHDSGTIVSTGTLSLGGDLHVADKNAGYLEFYLNKRWGEDQRYLVFHLSDDALAGKSGDFGSILSNLASNSEVPETYGHKGTWKMEWVGNDLFAVWEADQTPLPPVDPGQPDEPPVKPTPPSRPQINPELAGSLVLNSLWSTASNMKSLSGTAFSQIGISRFKLGKDLNFWGSALGDFNNHRSQGRADGYRYNGFGYSVGSDILFTKNNLVTGIAFGNLFGKNKSRDYDAQIDQTSYIGMLYARWMKEINKDNLLNIDGSVAFGTTANKLKTYYSDDMSSHGKWDNDAVRLTLQFSWDHVLNKTWTLTPFIGLEYDDASQAAFTETGSRVRNFQKSTLRNLALPAGIAISSQYNCFGGMTWTHNWAVSYVPDVYRENPESRATLFSQDYSWTARGIKPLRNAVGAEYGTRLQLNEAWTVFAGYSLNARKDSVYHNANIGFNYMF